MNQHPVNAYAKVNYALHITGRREDGYHLLDSLVDVFEAHDRIWLECSDTRELVVSGPFAKGVPTGPENLIWKAVDLFDRDRGLKIHLEKNLPHGAGIGGGSSDAAAVLRHLSKLWGMDLPSTDRVLSLGADVPVCLHNAPARMEGIGELLSTPPPFPRKMGIVLANPGLHVPTGRIFQSLASKTNPPMLPMDWAPFDFASFIDWCTAQRNDLQAPAIAAEPGIQAVLDTLLALKGCRLARMSGSGSTCFGLFEFYDTARRAAEQLQTQHPDWWVSYACPADTASK